MTDFFKHFLKGGQRVLIAGRGVGADSVNEGEIQAMESPRPTIGTPRTVQEPHHESPNKDFSPHCLSQKRAKLELF